MKAPNHFFLIPIFISSILFVTCKKNDSDPYISRDKFYGLSYQDNQIVFGSVDKEGNEEIITTLSGLQSFLFTSTTFNASTNYYIFAGRDIPSNSAYKVNFIDAATGNLVSNFSTTELDPASLQYLDDNDRLFGLGKRGEKLIFGSVDRLGNEQIVKTLPYPESYIMGSQRFDDKHDTYIFSSRSLAGDTNTVYMIDIKDGTYEATFSIDTLDPLTLEYSPKMEKFYGLGVIDDNVVLGSVDLDGREEVLTIFEDFKTYLGGSSTFDARRNYYVFTAVNPGSAEREVVIFSLRDYEIVNSFYLEILEAGTLE